MPRSNWQGYISFGLVTIPITLYSAEDTSKKLTFHQIDRRNHARIKYKRVNEETGKEVPWEEIAKAYEYKKNEIFIVEKGELERIVGENARTIAIDSFVDAHSIDFIDIEKSYYILPQKKGEKAYVVLRKALTQSKKIGIAKVIISTKEYLAALAVYKNILILYLLHYQDEMRAISEFDVPATDLKKFNVTSNEINVAIQLIKAMTKQWKPSQYQDEYRKMVHKWAAEKAKNLPHVSMPARHKKTSTTKQLNFVELLKQSLKNSKDKKLTKSSAVKKPLVHSKSKSMPKHVTRH